MVEKIYNVNGVKVCSTVNTNLNSFCLSLYIRAGSLFENADNNGISHLFEHVVFRNLKSKYDNFYELLAIHGIDFQGCTYKEFIRFALNGPSEEFELASEFLCGIFDYIKLSKSEFENEKRRIKAEIREEDERTSLEYLFNKIVWKDSEAERTVLGYCRVLDSISIRKLNDFRNKCFSEGNSIIYITGNVSQKNIDKLIKRIKMIDIQKNGSLRENIITVSDDFFNRKCIIKVKNAYWHYVKIGFDIDCSKCSNAVMDLLYAILFKCDKALLHNYLSEDNPIIYSYDSTLEQYDNVGNINFKFEVDKNKIEEAITVVVKLLNDVKIGCFNFEANLKAEMYCAEMEFDRPDDLNWSLAYYNHILKTQPIDYSDDFYGRFRITKEQVIDAAKEIFQVKNMTIVIKGNKKKINVKKLEDILKNLDL